MPGTPVDALGGGCPRGVGGKERCEGKRKHKQITTRGPWRELVRNKNGETGAGPLNVKNRHHLASGSARRRIHAQEGGGQGRLNKAVVKPRKFLYRFRARGGTKCAQNLGRQQGSGGIGSGGESKISG